MAFQSSAFQNNAFQMGAAPPTPTPSPTPSGGWGNAYKVYGEQERYREVIRQQQLELERNERELANAEQKRLDALAEERAIEKAEAQATVLQALLEEEISRLRNERVWLMRQIKNNQFALALLLAASQRRRQILTLH